MTHLFTLITPLLVGWILDRILADPSWLPHPIVLFGKAIHLGNKQLNKGHNKAFKGGIMAISYIAMAFISTYLIIELSYNINIVIGIIVSSILIFYSLAGNTLIKEVRMVFAAVDRSLDEGRKQVGRIVGRDTSELSKQEIKAAALETLAENLSDGVIAPLFWFALLGVPGMITYKMINTLDSMIGYKDDKYLLFGRIAAIIDDIANYIPARLTALLMIVVAPITENSLSITQKIKFISKYGRAHASPNSGYPESALASILNCRFGGTHNYFGKAVYKPYIGECDKIFTSKDVSTATIVNLRVEIMAIAIIIAIYLL